MASVVGSGRCIVAAAGTRQQLGATGTTMTPTTVAGPVRSLVVRAIETNTNVVVIGGSGVVAAAATRNGAALAATGPPLVLEDIDDLGDLWVDAVTTGEGLCFFYTIP